ncbi:hypothetical protein [Ferruginibacter sp.]
MKRNATLVLSAIVFMLLLVYCNSNSEKDKATYINAVLAPDSLCLVQPSWFPHTQTPPPMEGIGSPFDTSSTTNQIFHQWSLNKFLYLTKPDAGGAPLFLNQQLVKQVTTQMNPVNIPPGTQLVLQDIAQAGFAGAVLRTNPSYNNGNGDTVFYSIHMNPIMFNYADSIVKAGVSPANELTFPVGSFEMKVSWVPARAIPAAKLPMYYTATASLSRDGGKTFTKTTMALLGMHIVGVVQNHPEFIWATFEHSDLAPNYNWKANTASTTADKVLFKTGSVSGIGGIVYDTTTKLGQPPYQVFDLFQYGVPVDSTGNYMTTSQQEPINFNNVQGINQCVQAQLQDVWKNYFYNGSLWLNMDGTTPQQQAKIIDSLKQNISNGTQGSFARGSINCANVTMETFTQTFQTSISKVNVTTLANCFSCHHAPSFAGAQNTSPLYLSHVFQGYLLEKQGNTVQQVEAQKLNEERLTLKRLRVQ